MFWYKDTFFREKNVAVLKNQLPLENFLSIYKFFRSVVASLWALNIKGEIVRTLKLTGGKMVKIFPILCFIYLYKKMRLAIEPLLARHYMFRLSVTL
jgi:hypothetical protein